VPVSERSKFTPLMLRCRLCSAAECTRFERESFGAPHAMLANVSQADRDRAWTEIEAELRQFEGPDGFVGPCELLITHRRNPK